jgi:hypothetical protein
MRGDAQAIRGAFFLSDSVTPAVGIIVTATRADGTTAARALTSPAGDYTLALPAPGTYELRALRIGFRPSIVRDVVVAANATRVSEHRAVVAGHYDCRHGRAHVRRLQPEGPGRADLPATVGAGAGRARATHLWELSGALDVHLVRVDGHMDAVCNAYDSTYAVVDTASARESIVDRAFAATPPETLFARGYVRAREDGRNIYDMPNAETLLSDQFVGAHCFSIDRRRSQGLDRPRFQAATRRRRHRHSRRALARSRHRRAPSHRVHLHQPAAGRIQDLRPAAVHSTHARASVGGAAVPATAGELPNIEE